MTANDVESMLVRLTGDGSSYQEMLKKAEVQTLQTAKSITAAKEKIENMTDGMTKFGAAALSAFAAFGVKGFLTNAYDMFVKTETILLKLKTAVELNGLEAKSSIESYKAFADEMFNVSGVSKDVTLDLLRSAEAMGRSGDWAKQTAKTAIQLSTILNDGNDPDQFIMVQQALEQGNAAMLGRMQMLRGIHDPYRKLAMVQNLVNRGEATGKEFMKSTEGVMKMYTATVKALTKQFGQYVAEAVKPTIEYMTKMLQQFKELDDSTKRIIVAVSMFGAVMLGIGPTFAVITSMIGPVISLFTGGWKLISGLVMGIIPAIMAVGSALAALGLPLIAAIAAVVVVVGTLAALTVDYLGGIQDTWARLRDGIMMGWEWIKSSGISMWTKLREATHAFLRWIDPAIQLLRKWFDIAFRFTMMVVIKTWAIAKQVTTAFLQWVTPIINALGGMLASMWNSISSRVEEVWNTAGQFISDFFDWIMPMALAYIGVLSAVWETVAAAAVVAFQVIGDAITWCLDNAGAGFDFFLKTMFWWWDWAEVKSTSTWTNIKDFIVENLIKAEFVIRNFGELWSFMCAKLALDFITFGNQVSFFFQGTLPAVLQWFGRNWKDMFLNSANNAYTIMSNLVDNLVTIFKNLPQLVKGSVDLKDLWKDIGQGAVDIISEKLVLPDRVIGDLEKALREDVDRMSESLGEGFRAFREKRLKEINEFKFVLPDGIKKIVPEAKKVGGEAGSVLTKAFKENERLDAALFRSAEAMGRFIDYKERLDKKQASGAIAGTKGGTADAAAQALNFGDFVRGTTPYPKDGVPVAKGGEGLPGGDSVVVELLRRTAAGIQMLVGKKPIKVEEAGLS